MKAKLILGVGLVCVLLSAVAPAARASIALILTQPGSTQVDNATGNDGILFTTDTSILVTALDYFDTHGPGPLIDNHQVGIYDVAGSHTSPLVQATVGPLSPVSLDPSDGLYLASTPVSYLLPAGEYMLAGFFPSPFDDQQYSGGGYGMPLSTIHTGPGIEALNAYYFDMNTPGLDYPTQQSYGGVDYSQSAFLGPNFEYVIPEPATIIVWSLLGMGSWLGMRVWRRRGGPVGRQPWSNENRQAIHDIIAR